MESDFSTNIFGTATIFQEALGIDLNQLQERLIPSYRVIGAYPENLIVQEALILVELLSPEMAS